ncbi:hypothetical protein [Bacillus subtilis]|uniref:hypothetical protein n=1 Tax=Bacillus subtilis TaxID=1423 RepID=UPI0022EFE410|nr:hypothetical protein [Bacillus subtilis]WBU34670.1 hypothetical protein OSK17_01015 [Bacillus subtilis]WHX53735.1 hypothetical protein QNH30_01015 [Bacillus subtilis]WHX57737.1 hypothetical protein QNK02_01015 [Bacillus subtilis]
MLSLVSILLIFLNPNTITSMINMRVINNQNAGCTGDSSRLHPTAIGMLLAANGLAASSMPVVCSETGSGCQMGEKILLSLKRFLVSSGYDKMSQTIFEPFFSSAIILRN